MAEDAEYVLFSVVLFRRIADSFKAAARTRGFQVSTRYALNPSTCYRLPAGPTVLEAVSVTREGVPL